MLLQIPRSFPWLPPTAIVEHSRFVGRPHVLQGHVLCIYLDPGREWHPDHGIIGYLNRLYDWFADAAAGIFDARTALYHAVGGVLHETPGTPLVVVRSLPHVGTKPFRDVGLTARSEQRLDLTERQEGAMPALLIRPNGPLRYGAGVTVGDLLAGIGATGHPAPEHVAAMLARTARIAGPDQQTHFILAVPAPPLGSGDGERLHLVAGRLPADASGRLAAAAQEAGPVFQPNDRHLPPGTPIEWCAVSDERPAATRRRDDSRPVSAFAGASVDLWGCGALGSWMAEHLVRAGVRRIVVRDVGRVSGGLLVRQNFLEADVGVAKAEALAERLRAISDHVEVEGHTENALWAVGDGDLPDCDLIVDATVNTAVSAIVDSTWVGASRHPLLARVATDTPTATLALLTVCSPTWMGPPSALDEQARQAVLADPELERFAVFWEDVGSAELIPAPGCSLPTFHGAAADVAATSGVLLSLLAPHLRSPLSGTHLAALPIAPGGGPPHRWLGAA